jgi:aryl-alcohol dehydrogenase-like predicted oxidoreductase
MNAAQAGQLTLSDGITVNRMGYGAMRITGEGVWGEPDDIENAKRILHRALELGINLIDTADSYGPDVSERLIAEALYPYPDGLTIATKGGLLRPGPGEWKPNGRPAYLRQALEGSLKRLRVDTIDIYQFHRPDPDVPFTDSVGELSRLRDEGKIKHVGLSNVTTEQLEQALEIVPIVTVQNRYNIMHRADEDVLQTCAEKGIGFIPWFPLAAGDLTEASTVHEIAQRHNVTPYQIALAWLLYHSPVMLPIPGTSSVEHLEQNTAAAEITLSAEEVEALT